MIEISKVTIKKDKRFLLLKRCTISYPDTWDFAGGKHEPDETALQSVIRETKEETYYDINPGPELKKYIIKMKNSKYFFIILSLK